MALTYGGSTSYYRSVYTTDHTTWYTTSPLTFTSNSAGVASKISMGDEKESYTKRQEESGLKVGDFVKVEKISESYENGWHNNWISVMDNYVGHICTIKEDKGSKGLVLKPTSTNMGDYNCCFPYFVLSKVYVPIASN